MCKKWSAWMVVKRWEGYGAVSGREGGAGGALFPTLRPTSSHLASPHLCPPPLTTSMVLHSTPASFQLRHHRPSRCCHKAFTLMCLAVPCHAVPCALPYRVLCAVCCEQKDPGEYLLELQRFAALRPEVVRRYCIDLHLRRWPRALDHLAAAGPQHFEQVGSRFIVGQGFGPPARRGRGGWCCGQGWQQPCAAPTISRGLSP